MPEGLEIAVSRRAPPHFENDKAVVEMEPTSSERGKQSSLNATNEMMRKVSRGGRLRISARDYGTENTPSQEPELARTPTYLLKNWDGTKVAQ